MKKIYYIHPEEKVISSNEKISYTCPKINQFLQIKKNSYICCPQNQISFNRKISTATA